MRPLPLILIAAALCAGEGPPPHAGPPGGPPGQRPDQSPEEMFQKADVDKDGKVTLAELTAAIEAHMQGQREAAFTRMDSNGDGQISKEEFLAFEPPGQDGKDGAKQRRGPDPAEIFKRMDRNGDGVITADEAKRPEPGKGGPREGKGDGPREGKGHGDAPRDDGLLAP